MRWRTACLAAALVALVAVPYLPAARLGFIYDDYELIVDREPPRSLGELARVFAERHWPTLPYYRPIPRASMLAQKAVHGNEPAPYHALNLALIAAIALAAFLLLRTGGLALPAPLAFLGAALFALHPVASSSVYPIASGRETLWPTLFELLAVAAWLRPGLRARALALAAFAAALLSKEHAVVVPVLFALADALGLSADAPPRRARAWLRRHTPPLLLLLGYFALRRLVFAGNGALALAGDPAAPLLSLAYALQVLFAPTQLLVYEPIVSVWLSPWRLAIALVGSALLLVALFRRDAAARRRALFWTGWLLVGLAPTANLLVQEARFDERYVFFASLGGVALVCTALEPAWARPRARLAVAGAFGLAIAAAAYTSAQRAPYFASDAAFLGRWIESDPGRVQPHLSLGKLAARARDFSGATAHFERALEREAEHVDALNGLGLAYEALGQPDLAERTFKRALAVAPDNPWVHNNLGVLYFASGRLDEASAELEAALVSAPDDSNARINLALVRAKQGDSAGAIAALAQVLERRPGHAGACFNLGVLLAEAGDDARAKLYFERALDSRPDYALAHQWLGVVLMRLGEMPEADRHLRRARELGY